MKAKNSKSVARRLMAQLPPGSSEAVEKGCRCPVIDNHYGKGVPMDGGPQFWMNEDCPLHGSLHNEVAIQDDVL